MILASILRYSILAAAASAACIDDTLLFPLSTEHAIHPPSFNYTGVGGPLNWFGLDKVKNEKCATGSIQSPIDINTNKVDIVPKKEIIFNVFGFNGEFLNLGSTVEVPTSQGYLVADKTVYRLNQFHFHTPSEHRINNEHFPIEAHFVFKSRAGGSAVVGFFFDLDPTESTPLFDQLFASLKDIKIPGSRTPVKIRETRGLLDHFAANEIYHYTGSLTTPPCTEGVAWYISSKPLPLSVQSYNALKKVIKFNSRYTQNSPGKGNLLEVEADELLSTVQRPKSDGFNKDFDLEAVLHVQGLEM